MAYLRFERILGDQSMPGKQWPCQALRRGVLWDPRNMVRAELPEVQCAPCGASLYPRCSREELGRRFLGRLTYLEAKAEGNRSMSGKRWSSGSVQDDVPRGPCDMAKAELLEV
jgi:hypothetical protein